MTFPDWSTLGTYSGALGMVVILTQLTKEMPGIRCIPTRLWTYLTAVCVLMSARIFSSPITLSDAVLCGFHAAILALAANGGYDAAAQVLDSTHTT